MVPARACVVAVLVAVPWGDGCSNPNAVPVSEGIVTLDGEPLPNVTVSLVPLDDALFPINALESDDAGRFRLRTRGAGRYKVILLASGRPAAGGRRVPSRYHDPRTSPLEVVLPLAGPLAVAVESD